MSFSRQLTSSDVKSVWVDRMQILVRADNPLVTLRFFTFLPPDVAVEVSRLAMTANHAKEIIKLLAQQLDYYPVKSDLPDPAT